MALHAMENSAEATPRNIGTQCENVDLESAGANNTTRKELWLRSSLKKYFRLGVCTSDPLLNAVKWIAYGTEIGAVVIVAIPLIFYFLVVLANERSIFRSFEGFMIFAIITWTVGLMAFCYVHYMWVKPSRCLLLGLQQLSALEFLPWILTAFFHSVPPAYLYYRFMTVSGDTYPHYERSLRPDLTCWNWIVGSIIWTFILTPQIVVLAAAVRVRRLRNEDANVSHVVASSTTTSPQPGPDHGVPMMGNGDWPRPLGPSPSQGVWLGPSPSQYVCLPLTDVDLPETSQKDLSDLPPSYSMAVLWQCPPEYSNT